MDWGSERYVRLYTRETVEIGAWAWQARALWPWLLARCDRDGRIPLGRHGRAGLARLVRLPVEVVAAGLDGTEDGAGLLADGCVVTCHEARDGVTARDIHEHVTLEIPNFAAAQEAKSTIASAQERKAAQRARERVAAAENGKSMKSLGACHESHAPRDASRMSPPYLPPSLPPLKEEEEEEEAGGSAPAATPPAAAGPSPSDLQDAWNAKSPPLPHWRGLTPKRTKAAKARIRERGLDGPEGLRAVIARIAASPFCGGENERGWRADPDWLLQPDTATKVLEGKYDPARAPPSTSSVEPQRGAAYRMWVDDIP